jgi:hypothetical protein
MLLFILRFVIPVAVVHESLVTIRAAAADGDEAFVVWAGTATGDTFTFSRAIVPRQTAHKTPHGLLVTVDSEALFELNRDCHQRGELLAGQIHAHPTEAYHSPADDQLAIVAVPGGLSIVVPNFARDGLNGIARWVCFRLGDHGRWTPLTSDVSVEIV